MKKTFFDLITSQLSLFENPLHNYLAMTIIGVVAFAIAWNAVGEIGARGESGSILHWIIRIFSFVVIWLVLSILIIIVSFILNNWIYVLIIAILVTTLYILKTYADNNPDSILNKKPSFSRHNLK
ncbi:MAG: hypothetical protein GX682_03355 [Clostridiaceae bacterium]|nr:hypothetical protein [Clostridiaceae bacterium]